MLVEAGREGGGRGGHRQRRAKPALFYRAWSGLSLRRKARAEGNAERPEVGEGGSAREIAGLIGLPRLSGAPSVAQAGCHARPALSLARSPCARGSAPGRPVALSLRRSPFPAGASSLPPPFLPLFSLCSPRRCRRRRSRAAFGAAPDPPQLAPRARAPLSSAAPLFRDARRRRYADEGRHPCVNALGL